MQMNHINLNDKCPLIVEGKALPASAGTVISCNYQEKVDHLIPKVDPEFIFDRRFYREYRSWFNQPGEFGFLIVGPTGCGKTTGIEQFNARAGVPTLKVRCHSSMDLLDLTGSMNLTSVEGVHLPVSKYCYGPVSQAFKYGYTLIMDEQNLLDPGVACALNEVVRGDTLLIEATGEVIHRHPMFRYAATSNDWGRGHGETRFAGTNDQNAAFLNRFWKFAAGYPTQETEVKIITSKVPAIPEQMASAMVKVANFIRPQISGVGDGGSLDFDFSTRTLLQWSDMTVRFTNPENPKPALYALEITLLNMLDNEEKEVVIRACKDSFGNEAF